jgi:hypothetical protein
MAYFPITYYRSGKSFDNTNIQSNERMTFPPETFRGSAEYRRINWSLVIEKLCRVCHKTCTNLQMRTKHKSMNKLQALNRTKETFPCNLSGWWCRKWVVHDLQTTWSLVTRSTQRDTNSDNKVTKLRHSHLRLFYVPVMMWFPDRPNDKFWSHYAREAWAYRYSQGQR